MAIVLCHFMSQIGSTSPSTDLIVLMLQERTFLEHRHNPSVWVGMVSMPVLEEKGHKSMTHYIPVTEVAKLVRAALKEHFPGIKFSVQSSSYAGGASIRVEWTDGPTEAMVDHILTSFEGASFDSMTDSMYYHSSTLDGKSVRYGADFVTPHRKMSSAFAERGVREFCKEWNISMIRIDGTEEEAYVDTRQFGISQDGISMAHYLGEALRNTNAYKKPDQTSKRRTASNHAPTKANEAARKAEQERKEAERQAQEEARRKEEEAQRRREQEARERSERERQRQYEQARVRRKETFHSRADALRYLGLAEYVTDSTIIKKAFTNAVKAAADGRGSYTCHMDLLVQAKKRALQGW